MLPHVRLHISFFVSIALALPVWSTAMEAPKIPQAALEVLQTLPEQKITLNFVLKESVEASDSFRAVAAERARLDVPYYQSRSAIDTQFYLQGEHLVNNNEQVNAFAPADITDTGLTLGLSTRFLTGSALTAEIAHGKNSFDNTISGVVITTETFNTTGTLRLTQDLWKDGLGYATRKSLVSAEKQSQASRHALSEAIENWTVDLVQIYYNAWLAQSRAKASRDGWNRKKSLVNITKIKLKRGTAERPDLIQANNSQVSAEVQFSEAHQTLKDIWRDLLTTLKMPQPFFQIDPILVPMDLDEPIETAQEACGPADRLNPAPSENSSTRKMQSMAEASILDSEAAQNQLRPETQVYGSLISNGVDLNAGPTFSEAFQSQHPAWTVGLRITVPLANSAALAVAQTATANQIRDEAQASLVKNNLAVQWVNHCQNLHRAVREMKQLKQNYQQQLERVRLEERRFRLGRIALLNVIQAGDDATAAELSYQDYQVRSRLAAWNVRKLASAVEPYLQRLREKAL